MDDHVIRENAPVQIPRISQIKLAHNSTGPYYYVNGSTRKFHFNPGSSVSEQQAYRDAYGEYLNLSY